MKSLFAKNIQGSYYIFFNSRIILGLYLIVFMFGTAEITFAQPVSPKSTNNAANTKGLDEQFVVGKVLAVSPTHVNQNLLGATGMVAHNQVVTVEILEGPYKGLNTKVLNEITDNAAYNIDVAPGQEVILSVVTQGQTKPEINISDYHRAPALIWLALVFLAVFLCLGGKSGLKSLIGLATSILLIVFVLLPLSLRGIYPLLTAVAICLLATTITLTAVAGFSKKAFAAIIGTVGGVLIAGVAAQLVINYAPLTGLSSEAVQILRGSVLAQKRAFYPGLLAAGMLIGALGVIMDVGISIASAVYEISINSKDLSARALYQSGMNVGRDIMGTMTNTLVLAYAGGALPLLLLTSQMPISKLINLDLVATEVAAALSGSLGLICTIPLTAFVSALLLGSERIEESALFRHTSSVLENETNSHAK